MADPLSLAGLAIGVASLGLQVCGGITTYLDAVQCREQEIASVRQQNEVLNSALQAVESSLSRLEPSYQISTAAVLGCLDSCKTELNALETITTNLTNTDRAKGSLTGRIKDKSKALKYPFKRQNVQQLENRLRQASSVLQLALQALGT